MSTHRVRRAARRVTGACGVVAVAAMVTVGAGSAAANPPGMSPPACARGAELVVVRGTLEPGWLGTEIGDPLYSALRTVSPEPVSAYPVAYPANLLDPTSVARGTVDLVHHLITRAAECPDTPFVVAGYSQGAAIVHSVLGNDIAAAIPGIARLPPALYSRIRAVLLFGDPLRLVGAPGLPGPWRTGSWCTPGDPVCQLGGLLILAHVSYGNTIAVAAQFAANAL